MENQINISQIEFDHFGWRYFNKIKKKAMEQEFSWSGLLVSLSIAFFIVIFTALSLNLLFTAVKAADYEARRENKMYLLENTENYLQVDALGKEKIKNLRNYYLA